MALFLLGRRGTMVKRDDRYKYCYSVFSGSKHFGTKPNFIHSSGLPRQGFSSVYYVTAETASAIEQDGTTAQFKGVVWAPRLWIDVDDYEAAQRVEDTLKKEGLDFDAYDSGNRGAHFGILRDTPPSHLLPLRDKAWVQKTFPEADLSIYTHLHLFRLPGSIHEKTGRRKEMLESIRGRALELPKYEIKEIKLSTTQSSGGRSIFDSWRVMANCVPAKNGNRHPTLVKLAYALKQDTDVSPDEAYFLLSEANKLYEEPKEAEQIEQIIRSVFGSL